MKTEVAKELSTGSQHRQIHLRSLPHFSNILKGLRKHELTIFTGPTGCGKTTILSQMSLDWSKQGVPVLWGSFEIRNNRLAQVMLQQTFQRPITISNERGEESIDEEAFERASAELSSLPIEFMSFFGSTRLRNVLSAMEESVRNRHMLECSLEGNGHVNEDFVEDNHQHYFEHQQQHLHQDRNQHRPPHRNQQVLEGPPTLIILDNLQFMLSGQGNSAIDKWSLQEEAIASIRQFANAFNVHIMLVVHPRKEDDNLPLGISSVSGTAKATQEADNVIILQRIADDIRYLDVKKNRFHGTVGKVYLKFDSQGRVLVEQGKEESEKAIQESQKIIKSMMKPSSSSSSSSYK